MVDVRPKQCAHQGCPKFPSYRAEGSRKTVFCSEHKRAGMVNVRSKRCGYHGCPKQPSYGKEGRTTIKFCSEHKRAGMVDVINRRCEYKGCSKQPSYGSEGSRKAMFCSEHKRVGMVDVRNKRCAHQGCSKYPSYGAEGTKKADFCSEHKRAGMVDVVSKRCAYHGCSKIPSYGTEGSRIKEFCSEHKRAGMVDVRPKRCAFKGCSKRAPYGTEGSRKTKFCAVHQRAAGASNVEAAKTREEAKEMGEEAGGKIALSNTRKRPLGVERIPRQVRKTPGNVDCGPSRGKRTRVLERGKRGASPEQQQVSALVRESSPTPSLMGITQLPSQGSRDQCRVSATQNVGRDNRATSRTRGRSTRCGRGRDDVRDLSIDSCEAPAKSAQLIPIQGVARTDKGEGDVTGSTRMTGLGDGALGCGGGDLWVGAEYGGGDAFITSPCPGAKRDVSTTSSQRRRHTRASCAFVLKDRRKISSLEQEKRVAVVEAENLRDEVEELRKQVADAAVVMAHAVDEATGTVEKKYTGIIQALREELGSASRVSNDGQGALEAVCEERKELRQQVKAQAGKTEQVMKDFQQRIQALRAEVTATSTGWENTKDDLTRIRQERDALHKELEAKVAFDADIASKVAANSKALVHRVKTFKGGPGTAIQAQTRKIVDTIAPGPVDVMVEEGDADEHMGLSELKKGGVGEEAVSQMVSLDISTVGVKLEG